MDRLIFDEKTIELLVSNTGNPIWLVDKDCGLFLGNPAFGELMQYFLGHALKKGDNVLAPDLSKSYLDKFGTCYEQALAGKTFSVVEDFMVNNERKFAAIHFNPLYRDEEVVGVSCYAEDITDIRKHLFQISAQNKALNDIAFIQSHSIRGPVATILGLAEAFNFSDPSDWDNETIIRGIAEMAKQLDDVIKQVVKRSNEDTQKKFDQ